MADQQKVLGPYTIQGLLGRGGMGTVYRAVHKQLGREVALKVLPEPGAGAKDAVLSRRFVREASICARLNHPNIVRVFDYGHEQGCFYYAMELLEGRSLHDLLEAQPVQSVPVVLRLARDVVEAFACYFPQGIVHRDLKPANIMIDDSGKATLTDFGLVKDLMAPGITRQGAIVGTPAYIAPELVRGQPVTPSADIWSLGVLLFRMLSGRLPFEGTTPSEMLLAIARLEPASLTALNPKVPAPVECLVMNCLEKDCARRYGTAEEILEALELAARRAPVARRSASAPAAEAAPAAVASTLPSPPAAPSARLRGRGAAAPLAGASQPSKAAPLPSAPARERTGPNKLVAAGFGVSLLLAAGVWGLTRPAEKPAGTSRPATARTAPASAATLVSTAPAAAAAAASLETLGYALRTYDPAGRILRLGGKLRTASPPRQQSLLDAEAAVSRGGLLAGCLARLGNASGPLLLGAGLSWPERVRQASWLHDLFVHDLGHRAWKRPGPLGALEALATVLRLETRIGFPKRNLADPEVPALMVSLFPPATRFTPLVVTEGVSDVWDYENAPWSKRDSFGGLFETQDRVRSREDFRPFELPAGPASEVRFAAIMQDFDPQTVFLLHLQLEGSQTPLVLPLASPDWPADREAWYLVSARLAPGVLPPGRYRGWLTAHGIFGASVMRPNLRVLYLALPGR